MGSVQHIQYKRKNGNKASVQFLGLEQAKKVKSLHESFDIYKPTPLVKLPNLAKRLGVGEIYVKDESYRFGLNAFKVLGGSYAIVRYLAERLGIDLDELSYPTMISQEVQEKLGDITFVTATDGNHGRAIAWTANKLGHKSVVYMPKGSAKERLENIRAAGANAYITDFNYNETVRLANCMAKEHGWVLVQDTAWKGYEEIPTWIMQGYITMAYEAYEQLRQIKPTHIFVQAGVGSFAGAIQGFFADVYGKERPIFTVVEPDQADCIFRTAKAADGKLHIVTGDMDTIMAGLACGEPNPIGWRILRDYTDHFISIPDYVAARGMCMLGNPLRGDDRVIAGESGAAGFGLVMEVLTNPNLLWLKEALELDENSRLLFFNSEGDTDEENYRKIVWYGACHKP